MRIDLVRSTSSSGTQSSHTPQPKTTLFLLPEAEVPSLSLSAPKYQKKKIERGICYCNLNFAT